MSGIRICKANAPTALPMGHAVEILQMEPTWNYSQTVRIDTPKQRDLQHPCNQPPPRIHMRDLSNHTMDAMISTSSNADPSSASDVRPWPISNNSGRCSERHTGSHSKNRDKFTPRKPTRNPKRRNMVININGLENALDNSHRHNMMILCQGREDNPLCIKIVYWLLFIFN